MEAPFSRGGDSPHRERGRQHRQVVDCIPTANAPVRLGIVLIVPADPPDFSLHLPF